MKTKIIIVDLDGTIADSSFRTQLNTNQETGKLNFDKLHEGIFLLDQPIKERVRMIKAFKETYPDVFYTIITGRNSNSSFESIAWFKKYMEERPLSSFFRQPNDYRKAFEYKKEILEDLNKKYDIIAYYDDDLSCILEALKLGIKAIWTPSDIMDSYTLKHVLEYLESEIK